MERRRRALGLKKLHVNNKEISPNPKTSPAPTKVVSSHSLQLINKKFEDEAVVGESERQVSEKTPKHGVSRKTESESPLVSPGEPALNVLRMFGSPEVEVSWDWGCSQVTVDNKLTRRRSKRVSQNQTESSQLAPAPTCPRVLPFRQITEQENQERLAFYKEILSKSLKQNNQNMPKNNNYLETKDDHSPLPLDTTPKRSCKKILGESNKKGQLQALFDDSANDFMFECSQAIEEKLMKGEMNIGPVININISNKRLPHSPLEELESASKKVCNGKTKQNLFPESPKSTNFGNKKSVTDLVENVNHSNDSLVNRKELTNDSFCDRKVIKCDNNDLFVVSSTCKKAPLCKNSFINSEYKEKLFSVPSDKPSLTTNESLNNKSQSESFKVNTNKTVNNLKSHSIERFPSHNKISASVPANGNLEKNIVNGVNTPKYDCLDKFRKVKSSNQNYHNLPNNQISGPKSTATNNPDTSGNRKITVTNTNITNQETHSSREEVKSNTDNAGSTLEGRKPKVNDVSSLLDDGFDLDLCSLDFESLCCSSQPKQEPKLPPRICSEKEIEEKRKAALNRLMMKKKR